MYSQDIQSKKFWFECFGPCEVMGLADVASDSFNHPQNNLKWEVLTARRTLTQGGACHFSSAMQTKGI